MKAKISKKPQPVVVIMAGGEGKRLWPLSTAENPKQLNAMFSKKTMLVETYERACQLFSADRVVIVATEILANEIQSHITLPSQNLIVQPTNLDTAAAMGVTALHLDFLFPGSVVVLLYSDHYIADSRRFAKNIRKAVHLAEHYDDPIAIGTLPNSANTQFGYMELGEQTDEPHLYHVRSFHEKPDQHTAETFLQSGKYVWNTGVKVWHISSLLASIKELMPETYNAILKLRVEIGGDSYANSLRDWFRTVEPASFESVVSEHLKGLLVYVADYQWEDVGNWEVFYKLASKDNQGNAIIDKLPAQNVELLETKNCLVIPRQQHIAVIGLSDILIVQSDNKLLICRREDAGRVKELHI